jgi:hypothetical protein
MVSERVACERSALRDFTIILACAGTHEEFEMRKSSRKGVLLFAGVIAVCAFAVPSMASASSWGVIGTTHTLTSTNLSFAEHTAIGVLGWTCADTRIVADVRSAAELTITSGTFNNCAGTGVATGCTVTTTGTSFHWGGTGTSLTNVQISGVRIDLRFETRPAGPLASCALENQDVLLTGSLNGGSWGAAGHEVTYTGATGLIAHSAALGSSVVTLFGTFFDTAGTLTLT